MATLAAAHVSHLFDLSGQVALVTGAGGGLGRELAQALASAGALTVAAGRDAGALAETAANIAADGGKAETAAFDIDDADATAAAIDAIAGRHGRLDVLVNNAGVRNRTGFDGLVRRDFASLLQTNLISLTELTHRAAQVMIAGGRGGRIINIGSIASVSGAAIDPAYVASKAALAGITRAMANEYGRHAITVNEISPGPFATEFNRRFFSDPAKSRAVTDRTILGRWGEPHELCAAILFLASPNAGFITGQQIIIDGGYTTKA